MADQYKRHVAYKLRIGDILLGKPIFDNDKFLNLELGERKIYRTNVVGNIVDKYKSDGEKNYLFFTLDDGSGQIKLKIFDEEISKRLEGIEQGETVVVIGVLRNWNNETYIQPEIMRAVPPKYLLLRKMEIEEKRKKESKPIEDKKEIVAIKDKILQNIKDAEEKNGIDTEELIMKYRDVSPDVINGEVKKLLEEGIIFEPRPGRLRYLG